MISLPAIPLAQVGGPLFGNQWLALFAVLAGVAVFMGLIAVVGRWLAATHPDTPRRPRAAAAPAAVPVVENGPTPEVLAVIAASVAATLGPRARIAEVVAVKPPTPSLEMLMQQWSVEGRRQIYSSHQIR